MRHPPDFDDVPDEKYIVPPALTPERELILTTFLGAYKTLSHMPTGHREMIIWLREYYWLFLDQRTEPADDYYPFLAVCAWLNIHPEWIRAQVRRHLPPDIWDHIPSKLTHRVLGV